MSTEKYSERITKKIIEVALEYFNAFYLKFTELWNST